MMVHPMVRPSKTGTFVRIAYMEQNVALELFRDHCHMIIALMVPL